MDKKEKLRTQVEELDILINDLKDTIDVKEKRVLASYYTERRRTVEALAKLEGDVITASQQKVAELRSNYQKLLSFVFGELCPTCQARFEAAFKTEEKREVLV